MEAIELAFRKPNARIKIGTAFQTDLLEFILPTFEAVLIDCPADLRPVYKSQKSKWIVPHTKSEIKLIGLDLKSNSMRGNVIDLIILDEAGFMSHLDYLYKSVIIPATTHRPDCKILVFSTPPNTPAHEFLDLVQKAELEGGYTKLTIYDNPMVDAVTINRLMAESGGSTSTTWRREYLCEHVTDSNLAIIPEWKDSYIIDVERDVYYPFYHKYDGMDLGVRDNTAAIFGYYEFLKARLIIEDEYIINGPELTTLILKSGIRKKELDLWGEHPLFVRRISDNNNPLLLQDLSIMHGLHFSPTDKDKLEEMVNKVRLMVDKGQIIVNSRCKNLIGCLRYGVFDKNRDKFAQSKAFGHFDALAALVYLCRHIDKTTNPIPADFQVDRQNQIFFMPKRESTSAKTIRQGFGIK